MKVRIPNKENGLRRYAKWFEWIHQTAENDDEKMLVSASIYISAVKECVIANMRHDAVLKLW